MSGTIPPPPPSQPPVPKPFCLPPDLLEDDEFTEKRHQKELQFYLVGAVEKGDVTRVQELIGKGVNTNATVQLVRTPLTLALDQSDICYDVVAALLAAKATDPNRSDLTPWGLKPLQLAAKNGDVRLVKLFVEGDKAAECDINATDSGGATALHFAARYGKEDVVKYLVEKSADMSVKDNCGRTAFHRACEYQHIGIAQFLINNGMDVNAADNFGWTPLFHAVFFSHVPVVKFLLTNGARADLVDNYGKTLLEIACYNNIAPLHEGHFPEKVCLETSFNFYERSRSMPSEQFSDLVYDLEQRFFLEDHASFDCVKLLLNAGADPKSYPTDEMACNEFGVEVKIRAYLILAGAIIDPNDIWLTGTFPKNPPWRTVWFRQQLEAQLTLTRQCRYRIRSCLAPSGDIDHGIELLPLPKGLKEKLKLDSDFEEFMDIVQCRKR